MPRHAPSRWFRYRLRTLLVLMTLTAMALAGFQAYVQPFRVQRRAAERLAATGAILEYRPAGPAWLQTRLGKWGAEHFQHVVMVRLDRGRIDPDELSALADLPYLERLYLVGTPVTDQTLRHLIPLQRLRRLSLWRTNIGDEGAAHLSRLSGLEVLDVHHTQLTEAGLQHFRGHPRLTRLIHSVSVGDAGAEALASLPRLHVEMLTCKAISDEGLRHVAGLKGLKWLEVNGPQVTDDGLAALGKSQSLEAVTLRTCAATDAGIGQLAAAPQLKIVRVHHLPLRGDCLPALARRRLRELELHGTPVRFTQIARQFGHWATGLTIGREGMSQHGGPHRIRLSSPIAPEELEELERYRRLESLSISGPFDFARLSSLERLARLSSLKAELTISDPGAELLGRLSQLNDLTLGGRQAISPEGFQQLTRLKGLTALRMRSCGLVDEHLAFLADMPQLEILELAGNRITTAGIAHLHNLSQLRELNVSFCTELGNQAFEMISRLERLERLSAQSTRVTDAGLSYLFDMRHLRDVTVLGSRTTSQGMRALRGALLTKGGVIY